MYCLIQRSGTGEVSTFDGTTRAWVPNETILGGHRIVLAACGLGNDVLVVSPEFYDSIPDRSDKAFDLTVSRGNIDETVQKTVAGVIAALPPAQGGACDPAAIAAAVSVELARRLGNG
jgi:hypothetical protein